MLNKIVVKPIASGVGALVKAENVGDGTVVVYSNFKIMNARCSTETPTYLSDEDNQPYAVDLSKNDYVEFIDGFRIRPPYELIFQGNFKEGKLITLTNGDGQTGFIALKKISYTNTPFYYFSFETEYGAISHEIRTDYFTFSGKCISAKIDFSFHQNFYNLKANVYPEIVPFTVTDDSRGNVAITFTEGVVVNDDNNGNVVITDHRIIVSDDNNGNITISS